MSKSIYALMLLIMFALASIVPWADAQQKPSNVLIWCQNTNGTSSPCVAGNSLDYDSGGGTVNQGTVGLVFPASGGPVAAPGSATDGMLVNLGANNDVTVTGTVTVNAGTNTSTASLLTTSAHDAAFGTAGSADAQVRTVQGIASMTPLQVQSNSASLATETTVGTLLTSSTFTGRFPAAFASADNIAAQTATALHGLTYIWSGTDWDRWNGAVSQSGTWNITNISGTISLPTGAATEASVDGLEGGLGASADAAATVGSTGSANSKLRLITSQLDAIQTAVQLIDNMVSGSGVNISQINGVTPLMGAGNTGTGSHRVTEATDSQLSAGVGATGDAAATAGGTGSINSKLRLMSSQLDSLSTNLSSLLTSSQLVDDDQTGASVHYRTSAGSTEDEHEVKGSAGRLFSITATNTNAAVRYLRCANQVAASTTPGTTTVLLGLAIPGATTGAGFTTNFGPMGIAFSTGLTCWLVTGAADTDVAEVAANEIKVIYSYK